MTEDETFKKLQGISAEEANKMYEYLYIQAMDSPTTTTIGDVTDYVDERLLGYGWSTRKLGRGFA